MGKKHNKKNKKKKKNKLSFIIGFLTVLIFLFSVNALLQVFKKPAEIMSLFGFSSAKTPYETWSNYSSDFINNSTNIIDAHFLAALAQTESSGDPTATPQWRLRWTDKITKIFSPASSSVGLFQFTNATYERAKTLCIRNGKVVEDGPWHKWNTCWFNFLYLRISASHSIEMAAAYLTKSVENLTENLEQVSQKNKNRLAAIIHLCGENKATHFVRANFNLNTVKYCGSHSVKDYIKKIENHLKVFKRFS